MILSFLIQATFEGVSTRVHHVQAAVTQQRAAAGGRERAVAAAPRFCTDKVSW